MAAFMLVGAKLGDIWGRDRAFAVGLVVYATGSFITAISPNLAVLLFGWSLIEGLGAVLVVPAIAALVAQNYEGKERALAYGIVGGVAAAAIAAGPVIGGWVTTTWTWRLVFVGEVFIVAVILLLRKRMKSAPAEPNPPSLDLVGAALSASGLAIIVLAILQSSTWGFIQPRVVPVIAGREITPLGFSVVPFLILAGIGLLFVFEAWEQRLARLGRDRLLDSALLGIVHLRAGLATLGAQQLVLLGTFFVLPVYLQVVLGLNALETGLRLLPMSVTMLIAALTGPKIAARRSPKAVCRLGLVAISVAAVILLATLDIELNDVGFLRRTRGVRRRGRAACIAARERDHLGGPTRADERGRRPPGDRPEPRRVARDGAHRRDPADRTDERVRGSDHGERGAPRRGADDACHGGERAGPRGRPGRGGGAVPDGRRRPARSGRGHRDGLRRRAARRPPAGPRRGRIAGAARPVLHAEPARPVDRRRRSPSKRLFRWRHPPADSAPAGRLHSGRWICTSSGPSRPRPSGQRSTRSSGHRRPAGSVATGRPVPRATSSHGGHAARSQRDLLLPVLHAVQDRVGWISQPALNYVCKRLTIPPAEAYGVATFYALFATKPRPPVVAHVCDDIACRLAGAETLIGDMERALGPEGVPGPRWRANLVPIALPRAV